MLSNAVDRVVVVVVCDSLQCDVETVLAEHGHEDEVLQVVADAPVQPAVEAKVHALVVGHHAGVEP